MKKENYRWDIQGLRALAVMAVVIFHIESNELSGGYLGVDIFFVISGYLIIGFIWRDIALQKFTLANFYIKRIKRLFPALFVTVLATIIASYFLLLPEEVQILSQSVISTLLYVSNIFFYTQSDYFAADLELAPLLHTWSLSVEEQFYIIFPFILVGVAKWKPKKLQLTLIVVATFSFLLSEYLVQRDPSLSFFISPTRFWQFIAGGLLALNIDRIKISVTTGNILGATGLAVLILCLFTYSEKTVFPGVNAIIPTVATLIILLAGKTHSIFSQCMALPINRFFGNISYSLYLWHWPVIVFYGLAINNQYSNFINNIIVLVISIVLGYLSWRFVEQPFTRKNNPHNKSKAVTTSITASVAVIALMISTSDGLPNRFNEKQLYYSSYMNYKNEGFRSGKCFLTSAAPDFSQFDKELCVQFKPQKYNILLIGDSHAAHWNSALAQNLYANQTLTQITASGCRPVIPLEGRAQCTDTMGFGIDLLSAQHRFDKIILASRWEPHDLDKLDETAALLMQHTDNLLVIGRTLEYHQYLPRILATSDLDDIQNDSDNRYSYLKSLDGKFSDLSEKIGFNYLSLIDSLCPDSECRAVTNGGVPIAFDYGHFTHEGAMELINLKKPFFFGSF